MNSLVLAFGKVVVFAEEAGYLSSFIGDVITTRENQIELALIQEALGNYETAIEIQDLLVEDNDAHY